MKAKERRYDVISSQITAATRRSAIDLLLAGQRERHGGYVCFVNTHLAVTARENDDVREAINRSYMSLPDGRPVYVTGILKGIRPLEPVPGPDFMDSVLALCTDPPLQHYFLGGRQEVLDRLVQVVRHRFPGTQIAGMYSPPFRTMEAKEWGEVIASVRAANPDLIWVGLGAPKQELFMQAHWRSLAPAILLGVGAAFDFLAGSVTRAPVWMQHAGLEWCYRLACEPQRLWRRYFYTNIMFFAYLVKDTAMRMMNRHD